MQIGCPVRLCRVRQPQILRQKLTSLFGNLLHLAFFFLKGCLGRSSPVMQGIVDHAVFRDEQFRSQ